MGAVQNEVIKLGFVVRMGGNIFFVVVHFPDTRQTDRAFTVFVEDQRLQPLKKV